MHPWTLYASPDGAEECVDRNVRTWFEHVAGQDCALPKMYLVTMDGVADVYLLRGCKHFMNYTWGQDTAREAPRGVYYECV